MEQTAEVKSFKEIYIYIFYIKAVLAFKVKMIILMAIGCFIQRHTPYLISLVYYNHFKIYFY